MNTGVRPWPCTACLTMAWINSSGGCSSPSMQLHQFVAVHRQGLQHVLALGGGIVGQRRGNLFYADLFAVVAVEINGLHRDQVDHALEIVFFADWQLHQHGVGVELVVQLLDDAAESAPVRSILLMNAKRGTW